MADEESEVLDEEPGDDEETEVEVEAELLGGKFKTPDAAVEAYQQAEQELTRTKQELAELRARETYGGGQVVPQNPAVSGQDPKEYWDNRIYQDGASAVAELAGTMIQGAMGTLRQAQANVRRAVSAKRDHPMFRAVAEDFETELSGMDESVMANPQVALSIADRLFEQVVGRHAMKLAQSAKDNPAQAQAVLKSLGVASPQASDSPGKGESVTRGDREMLREMGLTGKALDNAVKRFVESEEEEK